MSHFTVYIFGEDIAKQLAPFDENDSSTQEMIDLEIVKQELGKRTPYADILHAVNEIVIQNGQIAIVSEELSRGARLDMVRMDFDHFIYYDANGKFKLMVKTDLKLNGKWDWFEIGGRWCGHFKPKPGATPVTSIKDSRSWTNKDAVLKGVSSIYKKDIDFEGMIADLQAEVTKNYKAVHEALGVLKLRTWKSVAEGVNAGEFNGDWKTAREFYWNQLARKRIRQMVPDIWEPDRYVDNTLDALLKDAISQAVCPFALIHNGQWLQRGQMHWFGITSNEVEHDQWYKTVMDVFNQYPDDTIVTVVDCHV